MAWLRSEQSLAGHPKTKRAARSLGISIPAMIGHLHCLWYWALDYAQDGSLSKYEPWEIADAALYPGEPDDFIDALKNCGKDRPGFLEITDAGLVIHDWYDYAGCLIDARKANTERMKAKRAAHVQNTCSARAGATDEEGVDVTNTTDETDETRKEGDAGGLLAFALRELPASLSTEDDYRRTLTRHQARLPRGQIERIVCELAEFKPKKPRDKLHLTLNQWLAKEEPKKGGDRERVGVGSGRSENGEW